MRIWVQVFSSRERNPNFHVALEKHLRSVAEPGVQIEVHVTRKFALAFGQKLKLYGLGERLASIEAMNFEPLSAFREAFVDASAHQRVMDEFDRAARRAVEAGAEVIIPCGSHAVLQARRGLREI